MIHIEHHVNLRGFNTLRLESIADCYISVSDLDELRSAVSFATEQGLDINLLGGGSNLILAPVLTGVTIHMLMKGRALIADGSDTSDRVIIRVNAGEEWHATVMWAHQKGLFGLENLALIPGSVGAAPVQNIGAYGRELADLLHRVHVFDRQSGQLTWLTNAQCEFAYRQSCFKTSGASRFIICAVELELSLMPSVEVSYPALKAALENDSATPGDVLSAVMRIRQAKLADPAVEPNVGSFFKNPVIPKNQAQELAARFPLLPQYPVSESRVKLSAAWLIDSLGWRGVIEQGVKISDKHALILINHSAKFASQITDFADKIAFSVRTEFGVALEREPVLIGELDEA